ncbi:mucin-19-like [Culex pipiens pallens]|uniref:mucin-19-like n=1 Tax=Culex pipiens pallens TaxID=42434 RepID=UPI0022AB289B|nr:mucin-19-like [Culex pipiens pallens]
MNRKNFWETGRRAFHCTNCICPAEAGQDTALPQGNSAPPPASNTPSSLEADASHLSGETPNSFLQPTSKRARHAASSTFRSANHSTQSVPANYSTHPGAFGTRCSSSAATVTTLPGLPTSNLVAPSASLTFRAGNSRSGICPAEASGAAAPSFGFQNVPANYSTQPGAFGTRCSSSAATITTLPGLPTPNLVAPSAPLTFRAANYSTQPGAFGTRCSSSAATVTTLPGLPTPNLVAPSASLTFRAGNARSGICPAEAAGAAAPSFGFQNVPANYSTQPGAFGTRCSSSAATITTLPGLPTPNIVAPSAPLTFRAGNSRSGICPAEAAGAAAPSFGFQNVPANYSTQPGAFGTRCSSSAATVTTLPGLPTPNLVAPSAPLTFRAGNARSGICPAEASGAAAPSFGFPTVPVFRFGSTTNRQSGSSRSASGQPQAHNAFQTSQSTLAGFHLPAANSSTAFSLAANTRVQPINNNPQSVPQQKAARPRNRKQLQPHLQPFLQPPLVQHNLAPPLQQTAPAFTCKHFYVKPFDPATTAEQIANYIQSRTGWSYDNFNCQRLTSESRSDSRPLTFVSFKVTVPDVVAFTNVITNSAFWPDFVSVDSFTSRRRS